MGNHNIGTNWFASTPVQGQTPFRRLSWEAWNRTGGALTQYAIYAFDMAFQVTAESSANSYGITLPAVSTYKWADPKSADGQASVWRNVRAIPASGVSVARTYSIVYCQALSATADNELGEMLVIGETTLSVIGTASTAYTAGWGIRPTPGQLYGTYNDFLTESTADADVAATHASNMKTRQVAISLAANTEAATPDATAISVFFNGFGI